MANFYQEIYKLVSEGLQELEESLQSGKTPQNPVSETHFLSAWVTKAIKQQRYAHCMAKTLMAWQQQARTMGKNAQLKQLFEHIHYTFAGIPREGDVAKATTREQIKSLYQHLEQADWLVTTEYEVNRKVSHPTKGQASLVVCQKQYQDAIAENGELAKPLSFYVRGDVKSFIDAAFQNGLLMYKVTDYKSKVKYHGEYIVYPQNGGSHIPELPTIG